MTNTINTNIAALSAQRALQKVSTQTATFVERLASGNRIINPSDDAAGLAIGTVLSATASTLRTNILSANQGKSLLGIADAGLASASDILKRAKDLTVQANAGNITDSERVFLDQEYQALLAEIDSISTTTKFNTTKLLDGSIAGTVDVKSNSFNPTGANTVSASQTLFTVHATTGPTDGQTITIGGEVITFTSEATRFDRVYIGAAANDETTVTRNLAAFLNSSTNRTLSQYTFTVDGTNNNELNATLKGGVNDITNLTLVSTTNSSYANGTGATATFTTANSTDGLGAGRIDAFGQVGDTVIQDITRGGVITFNDTETTSIRNNAEFIGNFAERGFNFSAVYTGTGDQVVVSIKIGDITYSATIADTTPAADTTVSLVGTNPDGSTTNAGAFDIVLRASSGSTVSTQADADNYAKRLNSAFEGLTFFQDRDVSSYIGGGDIVVNSNVTGSLLNTRVDIQLSDFTNPGITAVKVSAPTAGNSNGSIEFTVNGKTFKSAADIGTSIAANTYTVFTNVDDPREYIGFKSGATAISFSTNDNAQAFQTALEKAFGLDAGGTGLTFQVGTESTDTIDIKIKGISTETLGLKGTSIATANDAVSAGGKVDTAVSTLTAIRADVGALQSRFGFKIQTLSSAAQNTEAAASVILDTDVAKTSTAFAANQVKNLAGIAVLAQANQLPQNLLKLIG